MWTDQESLMIEVEYREGRPRLIVGPSTSNLRVPSGSKPETVFWLISVAEKITMAIRERTHATARGRFNFHSLRIQMHVGERQKVIGDFRFDLTGEVWER
jgi:hypothetical protein